jgi:hypothetical protein
MMIKICRKLCFAMLFCGLAFLLAACNIGGISINGSATSTPTPTPKATPTMAPSPTTSTLETYTGNGYTIGYPQGWTVTKGSTGAVTFTDPQGAAYLTIQVVPNPNGLISTSDEVDTGLQIFKSQAKNYTKVNIAPTTTVAGETWSQGAATGDITPEGASSPVTAKIVVISDNHPANTSTTQGFTIGYVTGTQVFDAMNTTYFQPMLQSFKFTS